MDDLMTMTADRLSRSPRHPVQAVDEIVCIPATDDEPAGLAFRV
jgi:hypothetical protein